MREHASQRGWGSSSSIRDLSFRGLGPLSIQPAPAVTGSPTARTVQKGSGHSSSREFRDGLESRFWHLGTQGRVVPTYPHLGWGQGFRCPPAEGTPERDGPDPKAGRSGLPRWVSCVPGEAAPGRRSGTEPRVSAKSRTENLRPARPGAIGITNAPHANCPLRVAKRLLVAQHGRARAVRRQPGERLGHACSKHGADFPYYHPNTISHKAITTHKSMKMCLSRSRAPR